MLKEQRTETELSGQFLTLSYFDLDHIIMIVIFIFLQEKPEKGNLI